MAALSVLEDLNRFRWRLEAFMAKGPAHLYTYGRWRLLGRWRGVRDAFFPPRCVDDASFFDAIDLSNEGLSEVRRAIAEGNLGEAKRALAVYFKTRTRPQFCFEPADRPAILSAIAEDRREETIRAADEICQNVFRFRRVGPVMFQDDIDWSHCPQGNIDWTWDLNRHTYFETLGRAYWYTGDERYVQKYRQLLLDWLQNNPASANQPSWVSVFEVAFRINTWIWAFYYCRSSAAFDDETCLAVLKGLLAHGRYLDTNLELHVQNNHVLLEAKALAMAGLLFPEFRHAERWRQRGLEVLYQQIDVQVCSDGVHGERATHYHQAIAGELLELLVLMENNNLPVPQRILESLRRMVEFELWITKPDGLLPLFGDSALGDTHLRFSAASGGPAFLGWSDLKSIAPPLDEASVWLLGPKRVKRYLGAPATGLALNSRAFSEGGYFVMRSGQGPEATYLAFDCGPFGYRPAPNHGHADALSFELCAFGQTLLVDPGVYSTHVGPAWRNFFRGSSAHNTIVVDSQDQSILLDTQRVYRPAQATLHQWISSDHFDFVDGSHNGYERVSGPITHRRQIFFVKPEYWVVIDWLTGQGKHCFDLYFHLMPGVDTRLDSQSKSLYIGHGDEPGLAIVPWAATELQADMITGDLSPIQGWVSIFSGEKQPAPTLRYRQEAIAPVQMCTVLYPHPAGKSVAPAVSALEVEIDDQHRAVGNSLTGLRVEIDDHVDYLVVERDPAGARKRFAGYETDARLVYVRHTRTHDDPVRAITRGGRQLLFQGRPLLRTARRARCLTFDCET